MNLKQLHIEQFRRFENREFEFAPQFNVVVGRNGAGKTSLFESIYILSAGKSFKTSHIQHCITFGKDYFFLSGEFQGKSRHSIQVLIGKSKKEFKLDGKKVRSFSQIIGIIPVIFMNYKLSLIVKGGPENRRNFLNHTLIFSDSEYYELLLKYYALLYRRNMLLKDSRDSNVISIFTNEIVPLGKAIQDKREKLISVLAVKVSNMMARIMGEKVNLDLIYRKSDVQRLEDKKVINEEISKRRTLFGPHLDDIEIVLNDVPAREFSSLGEAYSIAFAMRFAENEIIKSVKNEPPIILLDDFFSDLDEFHRMNILNIVKEQQVFISTLSLNIIPQEIIKSAEVILL